MISIGSMATEYPFTVSIVSSILPILPLRAVLKGVAAFNAVGVHDAAVNAHAQRPVEAAPVVQAVSRVGAGVVAVV